MKKMLLGIVLCLPFQLVAAEDDSVYSWGIWAQGIKPAAGPVASLTPAPVDQPNVNFRPNENAAFSRSALRLAPPVSPGAPQAGVVVSIPADLPVISSGNNLNTGGSL